VELLVVIGIIALLIAVLLPALSAARESSKAIKCGANLRSVGQGFSMYLAENKGTYPASYIYNVGAGAPHVAGGTANDPILGYTHWSWLVYSSGRTQNVPVEAFTCPSFDDGGHPPTNPAPADMILDQVRDPATRGDIVDQQVRRLAYTANEAIIPRNKFAFGMTNGPAGPGQGQISQYVKAGRVKDSANVILATEFHQNWRIIGSSGSSGVTSNIVKSHRPVHALEPIAGGSTSGDLNMISAADIFGREFGAFRPTSAPPTVIKDFTGATSRLAWVGRNHRGKTNFLYCDGHVESKTIEETLKPEFEWGRKVYSLKGEPTVQLSN
jgi:prepilin-type processing-associated H-X9-DG protein